MPLLPNWQDTEIPTQPKFICELETWNVGQPTAAAMATGVLCCHPSLDPSLSSSRTSKHMFMTRNANHRYWGDPEPLHFASTCLFHIHVYWEHLVKIKCIFYNLAMF